jgi:hypothetical protein
MYLLNLSSLLARIASNVRSSKGMSMPRSLAFSSNIGNIISKPDSVQFSSSLINLHIFLAMNDRPATSQIIHATDDSQGCMQRILDHLGPVCFVGIEFHSNNHNLDTD